MPRAGRTSRDKRNAPFRRIRNGASCRDVCGERLAFAEFLVDADETVYTVHTELVEDRFCVVFLFDLLTDESPKKILSCFVVLGGSHIYKVIYEF